MSIPSNPNPVSGNGRFAASNIPIGSVAYGSAGTNTADVNGQLWITDIWIPFSKAITKIGFLQGGTATTDNFLVAIYDSTGTLLGNSNTAGVVLSGASTFKEVTLLTTVQVYGPAQYWIAIQGNGTAAGAIQTIPTLTFIDVLTTVVSGTFGTVPASITLPTTFTAGNGPIVYVK
jgi:hypothetical protein